MLQFGSVVPLWSRQIPYTMAKFFFFEKIVQLFYDKVFIHPKDSYAKSTQLGITFASGNYTHLFVCLFVCLFICLFICLFVCLLACLLVFVLVLFVCLLVLFCCVYLFVYLYVLFVYFAYLFALFGWLLFRV